MAETLVENQVCNACGADVRPGALFCYSCGKSVAQAKDVDNNNNENTGDIFFHDRIAKDRKNLDNSAQEELTTVEDTPNPVKEISEKPVIKPNIQGQVKLKSAASLRRKSKTFQKKKVEILWEEHEDAPNVWFIVVAVILTVFAIGIICLAMYLR